jgi:hypothetical protein
VRGQRRCDFPTGALVCQANDSGWTRGGAKLGDETDGLIRDSRSSSEAAGEGKQAVPINGANGDLHPAGDDDNGIQALQTVPSYLVQRDV